MPVAQIGFLFQPRSSKDNIVSEKNRVFNQKTQISEIFSKELTLLVYQAYSRINQGYSLYMYLPTSKIQNLLLFVTNITNQSEILFLISINLFLILISMLILLSLEIVKIQNMFINQLDILLLEI